MNIMSVTLSRSSVLIDTWWNVNGIHFFMNKEDVVKFQ